MELAVLATQACEFKVFTKSLSLQHTVIVNHRTGGGKSN